MRRIVFAVRVVLVFVMMVVCAMLFFSSAEEPYHYTQHGQIIEGSVERIVMMERIVMDGPSKVRESYSAPLLSYTLSDGSTHGCTYSDYNPTREEFAALREGALLPVLVDEHFPTSCHAPEQIGRYAASLNRWITGGAVLELALLLVLIFWIRSAVLVFREDGEGSR